MVLPKKIESDQSYLLFSELILFWQEPDNKAFPSEEWLDDIWVHEPYMRDKIRKIFSAMVEYLDEEVEKLGLTAFVRDFKYDKADFSGGFLKLSKSIAPLRSQNTVLRYK